MSCSVESILTDSRPDFMDRGKPFEHNSEFSRIMQIEAQADQIRQYRNDLEIGILRGPENERSLYNIHLETLAELERSLEGQEAWKRSRNKSLASGTHMVGRICLATSALRSRPRLINF